MPQPTWIRKQECCAIHDMMVARYGGDPELRAPTLLAAALAGPRERFARGNTTLPELAACYVTGFAQTRPFVSANVSTAFLIAATFLRVNGLLFTGKEQALAEEMFVVAAGEISESAHALYWRCNSRSV